jgi:hypothetical protein
MNTKRINPRTEYRQQENLRVLESPSLERAFPNLKSLTVNLAHFDPEGARKASELKYTVNLAFAKALFRVNCANSECVSGDFDLSEELAKAVAARQKTISGELRCQGWRSKTTMHTVRCDNLLRFELSIKY